MAKNIYEDRSGTQEEIDFPRAFRYLLDKSLDLIGTNPKGVSILDIGCGGLSDLGLELKRFGVMYTGLDKDKRFLQSLSRDGLETMEDNILTDFSEEISFDITHARILLMHMSEEQLPIAIRNILSLTTTRSIFLDLDWSSFKNGGNVTETFQNFALRLIRKFSDPFIGSHMLEDISKVAYEMCDITELNHGTFHRVAGAYYFEIIPLVKMMIKMMEQKKHELLDEGKKVLNMITEESTKSNPEKFIPPDLKYVEVVF